MRPNPLLLAVLALTLPLAGAMAATFTNNTTIGAGDTTYDGQDIVVSGCTLTVDGPHGFASLGLTNAAVLTHSPAPNGETNNRLDLTITGDVMVDATSRVDASGKGYGAQQGPGAGRMGGYALYATGAGHGGTGGTDNYGVAGGAAYGSPLEPAELGSGGGTSGQGAGAAGSAGGGRIRLDVAGTLRVDGLLAANALHAGNYAGGGSGGSIWVTAGALTGGGSIQANGGNGGPGATGGGGGGRMALQWGTHTFAGSFSAAGGAAGRSDAQNGGAGTIYLRSAAEPAGDLLVDNEGLAGALTPLDSPAPFNLRIRNQATVQPAGALILSGLQIMTNGVLTQPSGSEAGLELTVLGDVAIEVGGAIDVSGKGYGAQQGPGAGRMGGYALYATGAGHGGAGGTDNYGVAGGAAYGSPLEPAELGSGGGTSGQGGGAAGSAGGGRIRLDVAGTLRVDGLLAANALHAGNYAGGGSGGSIWVTAGALTGGGSIQAYGGNGGPGNTGAGGGGRIAIYTPHRAAFTGAVVVIGGVGGWGGALSRNGQDGTLHESSVFSPLQVLSMSPAGELRQPVNSVDVAFNQPVRSGTFTTEDVLVTAPSGPIPSGDLTVTPLSAASFRVAFPLQNTLGAYQVQVGPHLENLYGQEMAAVYTGGFTVTNPLISGIVRWTNGAPLSGVLLSATDGLATTTGTNGAFTLSVPPGWSGTVTPALAGWVFTPPGLGYANLAADATGQNFAAEPTGYVPSGLLSWWPGEGDTGDILGLHPGTPVGGLSYTDGPVGRAFAFNGQDAAVALGNWFDLQTFTLSLWVQPAPGQVTYADIVDNNHTDDRSWCLQYDNVSDATLGRWHWGTSLPSGGGAIGFSLRHNAWQHWVVTLATNGIQRLYIDGALAGATTNTAAIPYDGTQFFNLGKHQAYGRYFSGALDEVMVFNRALDADEVASLCVSQGGPPTLDIERQGGSVQLSWPTANSLLESSPGLTPADWQTVTHGIQTDGLRSSVTVPATNQHQFFRLKSGN